MFSFFSKHKRLNFDQNYSKFNDVYGMDYIRMTDQFNHQVFPYLERYFDRKKQGVVRFGYIPEDAVVDNGDIADVKYARYLIDLFHETKHISDCFDMLEKRDDKTKDACMNYIAASYNPSYGRDPGCYNHNFREISAELYGIGQAYRYLEEHYPGYPNETIVMQAVKERDEEGPYFLHTVLHTPPDIPTDIRSLMKSGQQYVDLMRQKDVRYRQVRMDETDNFSDLFKYGMEEDSWEQMQSVLYRCDHRHTFDKCLAACAFYTGKDDLVNFPCLERKDLSAEKLFGMKLKLSAKPPVTLHYDQDRKQVSDRLKGKRLFGDLIEEMDASLRDPPGGSDIEFG